MLSLQEFNYTSLTSCDFLDDFGGVQLSKNEPLFRDSIIIVHIHT